AWLKINGLPAKYDATAGFVPTTFPAPGPLDGLLWGDANLDGVVNAADYSITRGDRGLSPANWSQGDFNFDGRVSQEDLNLLLGNVASADSFLPEPAGAAFVALATCLV